MEAKRVGIDIYLRAGLCTHLAIVTLWILLTTPAGSAAQNVARAAENLYFGDAVSLRGNLALVGAPGGSATGNGTGLAYVFARAPDGWKQAATLSATGGKRGNNFGSALALAENTALVGAWGTDGIGPVSGSAFVFERGPDGWNQAAVLINPDARDRHVLGYSVALDAATAVVGAPGAGAVYIWSKDEAGWRYRERITHFADSFGRELSLHEDVLVVSAHNRTVAPGYVYVYRRRNGTWKEEAQLRQNRESFGVAVAATATTIAVASSGLVFLYADTGAGWNLQGTVEPRIAGELSGFQYGGPVAIDGNILVVGAPRYAKRKGAVHIVERVGSSWNQIATIIGNDTRPDSLFGDRAGDLFGRSVAIHGDRIIVGASFHDSEGPNFGAAYVFTREGTQWVQTSKLVPPTERHRGTKSQ